MLKAKMVKAITALADGDDLIEVQAYSVDMNVRTDRKVEVKERITVKFLDYDLTMFYRSLPTKGCKYEDFVATCEGNGDFFYKQLRQTNPCTNSWTRSVLRESLTRFT